MLSPTATILLFFILCAIALLTFFPHHSTAGYIDGVVVLGGVLVCILVLVFLIHGFIYGLASFGLRFLLFNFCRSVSFNQFNHDHAGFCMMDVGMMGRALEKNW